MHPNGSPWEKAHSSPGSPPNGLGFTWRGPLQDVPGKTNKRQPKAGSFRVQKQGKC